MYNFISKMELHNQKQPSIIENDYSTDNNLILQSQSYYNIPYYLSFSNSTSSNFSIISNNSEQFYLEYLNNTNLIQHQFNHTLFCEDEEDTNDEDALSSSYFKTAVYILYISIFLFALLGNGIVCYIVQSTPRMRTVTNYFIANLAVGDILMSLFCVPFSFVSILILRYWPFGIILCHLVNYSQAVSVLVSAYTLVAISIDRYIAIMWPLRPRITKR